LKILLLDDDRLFTQYIKDIMSKYEVEFDSANTLEIAEYKIKNNQYDLLFLDIVLGGSDEKNGIQFIKDNNLHEIIPYIVVMSGFERFSLEAYQIHPFDFLVKPIRTEHIVGIIDAIKLRMVQTEIMSTDDLTITVRDKKNVHRIPLDEVLFIEKMDKEIIYHFKETEISITGTLSKTKKLLPSYFVQSHRAFIINLKRIISIIDSGNRTYAIKFQNTEKEGLLSRGYAEKVFKIIRHTAED